MSTKEFTYQEIAELNKEFNTANAFTKWKFMQTPEYAKLPDAVRYTVEKECLTHYFNILTDGMPDWKLPISGVIPIALLNPFRAIVLSISLVLSCLSLNRTVPTSRYSQKDIT